MTRQHRHRRRRVPPDQSRPARYAPACARRSLARSDAIGRARPGRLGGRPAGRGSSQGRAPLPRGGAVRLLAHFSFDFRAQQRTTVNAQAYEHRRRSHCAQTSFAISVHRPFVRCERCESRCAWCARGEIHGRDQKACDEIGVCRPLRGRQGLGLKMDPSRVYQCRLGRFGPGRAALIDADRARKILKGCLDPGRTTAKLG
jgi:hypothetical protein